MMMMSVFDRQEWRERKGKYENEIRIYNDESRIQAYKVWFLRVERANILPLPLGLFQNSI
jgi:hypothetical protein